MGKIFTTGLALLAVLAVTAVLISPMPDELPGTAAKHGMLSFVVAVSTAFDLWSVPSSPLAGLAPITSRSPLDVLAVTCTRLC